MIITLFGTTATIGRHPIDQALALAAGHSVTAVTGHRDPIDQSSPHLKILRGDVRSADDVRNAVRGQDAVIGVLGAIARWTGLSFDPSHSLMASYRSISFGLFLRDDNLMTLPYSNATFIDSCSTINRCNKESWQIRQV